MVLWKIKFPLKQRNWLNTALVNTVHKISIGFPKILAKKLTTSVSMGMMQIAFKCLPKTRPNSMGNCKIKCFIMRKTFRKWEQIERAMTLRSENISWCFYLKIPSINNHKSNNFLQISHKTVLGRTNLSRSNNGKNGTCY